MKRGRIGKWVAGVVLAALVCSATARAQNLLDEGYRDMYNLQFARAHDAFRQYQQQHPDDPIAPASDAAAFLFNEFDRLHVLEVQLFVDDSKYETRERATPDPATRQGFEADLAKSNALANKALEKNPKDADAQFALAIADGLRADYLSLIDRRDMAALSYVKSGRLLAEKLLAQHPDYFDGYLAVGVENYLLSLKPAPVRWFLKITGSQTDKQTGIEKLRITAEKGRYLLPYARLLLAVAALRDGDRAKGIQGLQWLAQQFPQNHLYSKELAKIEGGAGLGHSAP